MGQGMENGKWNGEFIGEWNGEAICEGLPELNVVSPTMGTKGIKGIKATFGKQRDFFYLNMSC